MTLGIKIIPTATNKGTSNHIGVLAFAFATRSTNNICDKEFEIYDGLITESFIMRTKCTSCVRHNSL